MNQQRLIFYARRNKLLIKDAEEIQKILTEVEALSPEIAALVEHKKSELGTDIFGELFGRVALQVLDTLWVEHLEVMGYARSSVSLRAYGQRDPLVEYRKEGTQLFAELQHAMLDRIAQIIPQLRIEVVEREEVAHKKEAEAALRASVQPDTAGAPQGASTAIGRNEMVTITDGNETQTLKFKKAEPLLAEGWKLVS